MSEEAEEITVKLKYDPNKEDMIEVSIKSNATVADLKNAFTNKLQEAKGDRFNDFILENPIGLLKLGEEDITDENETLDKADIENDSVIQNENRVFIKTWTGQTSAIICNKDTTLKGFLDKAIKKIDVKNGTLVRFIFAGKRMEVQRLNEKLFNLKGENPSVYGLTMSCLPIHTEQLDYSTVFNLQNLDSSEEQLKKAWDKYKNSDAFTEVQNVEEDFNKRRKKSQNSFDGERSTSPEKEKRHRQNNWPLSRKIIGVIDLILLAAAVATFLLYFLTTLSLSVAVPIVLAALFVVGSVLFFGWNKILPKILPEGCLKKINSGIDPNEDEESKNYEKKGKVPSTVNEYENKI